MKVDGGRIFIVLCLGFCINLWRAASLIVTWYPKIYVSFEIWLSYKLNRKNFENFEFEIFAINTNAESLRNSTPKQSNKHE